jgi:chaperonin GroES
MEGSAQVREDQMRPLHDRVIIKRIDKELKTASGIVLSDGGVEKPDRGEVIAVGPGKYDDNGNIQLLSVKVGDMVLFGKYSGQAFKIDNQELLTMRENDIIGLVEE